MSDAPQGETQIQRPATGVVGWFKRVTGKLGEVMAEIEAEEAQKAATGKLPPPAPAPAPAPPTGRGATGPGGAPAARSGPLPTSRPLAPRAAGTGRIEEPKPVSPLSEEATNESNKRLAFIIDYMKHLKQPSKDELFTDKPFVYRVLTEERTHQQHLAHALRKQLAEQGADGAAEARLADALKKQSMIFTLMKSLTGRLGKTGGTGFLGDTDD